MDETLELIEQMEMEAKRENEEETVETGINYHLTTSDENEYTNK